MVEGVRVLDSSNWQSMFGYSIESWWEYGWQTMLSNEGCGPSKKAMNFRTLFTPGGNGVDVVVPVESTIAISERFANTEYGFFLGKRVSYPVVANYFSSMKGLDALLENGLWFICNNPRILKKWNPNVNLLKEDVVPLLLIDTHLMLDSYTSDMCIQSWGRSSYARALIEVQADVELKDNIVVAMPKLVGGGDECTKNKDLDVANNMKKTSKTHRGVLVGPKVGFQPTKQVYRQVSKKSNVSISGNKKKDVEPTIENVDSSSTSTTPVVEKIDKMERLIIDRTATLVDDEGKLLTSFDSSGDHDSEDEVASVDNDMANFQASKIMTAALIGMGNKIMTHTTMRWAFWVIISGEIQSRLKLKIIRNVPFCDKISLSPSG
ncbi:hypothetical protein Tco_0758062 [Tanacetum coccineum]